jgi:protein-disulfide isomerase-like protein with CxxC motif
VRGDFAMAQSIGIRGFPALCAAKGNELHMITNGFAPLATLEASFAQLEEAA